MDQSSQTWNRAGIAPAAPDTAALMERVLYEVKRVVVGQEVVAEEYETFELDAFARVDGFENAADMSAFWRAQHGTLNNMEFNGVLIRWNAEAAQ